MEKKTEYLMTSGIASYVNTIDVPLLTGIAERLHTDENYFIAFKPKGNQTTVTNGNNDTLMTLNTKVPETMYYIRDDYGDRYVSTLLFCYEY
jgi:hypothetical protein